MAARLQFAEDRLHDLLVAQFGGADKIVDREIELLGKNPPVRSQFIAISLRLFSFFQRGLLDLLAVFIQSRQEKHVVAEAAVRARDDIRDDLLVGVAEMRLAVYVVNRGRDVIPFRHFGVNLPEEA